MRARIATFLAVCMMGVPALAEPVAEILTVRGQTIYPTNVAAEVATVASAAAKAEASAAEAQAVAAAAGMVATAVSGVEEIVNSLEGVGYIRGYVLQFGAGIEASTNVAASIVKFSPAGDDTTNAFYDLWTYFTEDPGTLPVVRYSRTIGRTNVWSAAEATLPEIEEVLVGSTLYEAYRTRATMPLSYTGAYFRVFADLAGAGTNAVYLPVRNGVSVNGAEPLTAAFTVGTNVLRFVGGVRVQ